MAKAKVVFFLVVAVLGIFVFSSCSVDGIVVSGEDTTAQPTRTAEEKKQDLQATVIKVKVIVIGEGDPNPIKGAQETVKQVVDSLTIRVDSGEPLGDAGILGKALQDATTPK